MFRHWRTGSGIVSKRAVLVRKIYAEPGFRGLGLVVLVEASLRWDEGRGQAIERRANRKEYGGIVLLQQDVSVYNAATQ